MVFFFFKKKKGGLGVRGFLGFRGFKGLGLRVEGLGFRGLEVQT